MVLREIQMSSLILDIGMYWPRMREIGGQLQNV